MEKYESAEKACQQLSVCNRTLVRWANKGKIDYIKTPGGWRKYNTRKYMKKHKLIEKKKICYARVSSYDRKEDLDRQIQYLTEKYPDHEPITDIGSGINFKRKGLQKIIELAISDDLSEVVITYKDRLCRIGYDLIEFILKKYSNAEIKIENDEFKLPHQEITEDLIEIVTVYSFKIHGSRSHKNNGKLAKMS